MWDRFYFSSELRDLIGYSDDALKFMSSLPPHEQEAFKYVHRQKVEEVILASLLANGVLERTTLETLALSKLLIKHGIPTTLAHGSIWMELTIQRTTPHFLIRRTGRVLILPSDGGRVM